MKEKFRKWLNGEIDPLEHILDSRDVPDAPREEIKLEYHREIRAFADLPDVKAQVLRERAAFSALYNLVAVVSCAALIAVLLYVVSQLPLFGEENARALEVYRRYIEQGLQETGAVNIVSGLILDYRAFDTLGESHVLFTALVCSVILLRIDRKNMRPQYEDYYTLRRDEYFDLSRDGTIRFVCGLLIPCVLLYGVYILLNGQNSPGGGFSGGAVIGGGLILFSAAYGFGRTDRFFTEKLSGRITLSALAFYSFAKGYVFFMGANGLDSGIPKGTPGAIFSGGLILPLDAAVGAVVACTMYGFYSLFRRGSVGGNGTV